MKNEEAEDKEEMERKAKIFAEVVSADAREEAIYLEECQDAWRRMHEQEAEELRLEKLKAESPVVDDLSDSPPRNRQRCV